MNGRHVSIEFILFIITLFGAMLLGVSAGRAGPLFTRARVGYMLSVPAAFVLALAFPGGMTLLIFILAFFVSAWRLLDE